LDEVKPPLACSIAEQKSEAVEPCLREAAAQIGNIFEAAALQRAGGEVAALPLLAVDEDFAIARQLAKPVAEFTHGNMHGIEKHARFRHFAGFAHIERKFAVRLPVLR